MLSFLIRQKLNIELCKKELKKLSHPTEVSLKIN